MTLVSNWLWALRTGSQNKLCSSVIVPLWNMSAGINRGQKGSTVNQNSVSDTVTYIFLLLDCFTPWLFLNPAFPYVSDYSCYLSQCCQQVLTFLFNPPHRPSFSSFTAENLISSQEKLLLCEPLVRFHSHPLSPNNLTSSSALLPSSSNYAH